MVADHERYITCTFWAALLGIGRWQSAMPRCSACVPRGDVSERKSTRLAFGHAQSCLCPRQVAFGSVKRNRQKVIVTTSRCSKSDRGYGHSYCASQLVDH